jgi:CPA2 family monovalent cation:H+ antiporter-2
MPEMSFLQDLLVLFGLGTAAVVAFHRLNLPPVLGFLITGVICGPFGFKLVDDSLAIETLAEIGLVLLLFTIGIEFSVKTFFRLRKFLLIAGGLQVAATVAAGAVLTHFTGLSWASAAFIGMLVSLSSTAIVLRLLEYRGDIDSAYGRSALSILIFQDLCIVPMVLITPFLGGQGGSFVDVALLTGKALIFLVLAATVARYLVPWLLNQVARTKKREAFVLSIILICLGTATATSHFGLSMALGAFIAGLIISESKYNHQALGEIVPFREVFNCLVFVSIGMLFDIRILLANPVTVILGLLLVIAVKAAIGAAVTGLMGNSLRVALLTGFSISQISEFSFVLAKVGLNVGLLDAQTNQLFLAVAILSMFMTPASLSGGGKLAQLLERVLPLWLAGNSKEPQERSEAMNDHVIIVGFGLGGRNLAAALADVGVSFTVIEHDPQIVRDEKAKGTAIMYGDASRQEVLMHAGVDNARVLALTLSHSETVLRSAEMARRINPGLHIIARAEYMEEVEPLIAVGTQEVIPEEFVGSVEMTSRVLQNYLLPRDVIERCVQRLKNEQGQAWLALYEANRPGDGLPCIPCDLAVEVRRIPTGSLLVGKNLLDTGLRPKTGVTVVAIQRADGSIVLNPKWDDQLQAGDSVILLGHRQQFALAAEFFANADIPPAPSGSAGAPVCPAQPVDEPDHPGDSEAK